MRCRDWRYGVTPRVVVVTFVFALGPVVVCYGNGGGDATVHSGPCLQLYEYSVVYADSKEAMVGII